MMSEQHLTHGRDVRGPRLATKPAQGWHWSSLSTSTVTEKQPKGGHARCLKVSTPALIVLGREQRFLPERTPTQIITTLPHGFVNPLLLGTCLGERLVVLVQFCHDGARGSLSSPLPLHVSLRHSLAVTRTHQLRPELAHDRDA